MTLVDNNVLSALAKVERLDVLPAVFDEIETSAAVVAELERARAAGYEFVDRVDAVKSYNGGWMDVYSATEDELEFARRRPGPRALVGGRAVYRDRSTTEPTPRF